MPKVDRKRRQVAAVQNGSDLCASVVKGSRIGLFLCSVYSVRDICFAALSIHLPTEDTEDTEESIP
jgi:hypothetical protein